MPRIGFDARFWGASQGGIGRYIREILPRLAKVLQQGDELVVYTTPANNADVRLHLPQVVRVCAVPWHWYGLQEQLQWLTFLNSEKLDLLHVPHVNIPLGYSKPFVVTVHDLILREQPFSTKISTRNLVAFAAKYMGYRATMARIAKRAERVIAVSHATAKTLARYYPKIAERTLVIYEGVSAPKQSNEPLPKEIQVPYICYVGALYPHKNVDLFLNAFARVQLQTGLQFVLAGPSDTFREAFLKKVNTLEVGGTIRKGSIVHLGYVSDEVLDTLYRQAHALVQPSLVEGFGFTPQEALVRGTRVLVSNIPVFHEFLGSNVQYIDAHDSRAWQRALVQLMGRSNTKIVHDESPFMRQSWDECATLTARVYNDYFCAHGRKPR